MWHIDFTLSGWVFYYVKNMQRIKELLHNAIVTYPVRKKINNTSDGVMVNCFNGFIIYILVLFAQNYQLFWKKHTRSCKSTLI